MPLLTEKYHKKNYYYLFKELPGQLRSANTSWIILKSFEVNKTFVGNS